MTAAAPLAAFTSRHNGIASVVGNLPEIALCVVAWWVIILAFVAVALHLVMTIVELHFSILLSAVLFPWGALSHTAFLCELVVSWLTACLVRILVTVAFMSISVPLFTSLSVVLVDGDPEILSVVLLLGAAGIFALLAWIIPNRAAQVAGRGASLGLTGGLLLPTSGGRAMAAGGRALLTAGGHAVAGVSRMIQARRGG